MKGEPGQASKITLRKEPGGTANMEVAAQKQRLEEQKERWQLEKEERRQRLEKEGNRQDNGFLVERALLAMMIVAFVLFAAGGSGAMAVLSLVMLMLYRVMKGKGKP